MSRKLKSRANKILESLKRKKIGANVQNASMTRPADADAKKAFYIATGALILCGIFFFFLFDECAN